MRPEQELRSTEDARLSTEDMAGAGRQHDEERPENTDADTSEMEVPVRDPRAEDTGDARDTGDEPAGNGHRPDAMDTTDDAELTEKAPQADDDAPFELFPQEQIERFRDEWRDVQTRFVDDPRDAVQSADHLVAEVMQSLASTFAEHKHELEGQWQQGSEVETEDLRQALRRYRSFFNQLLHA